MAATITPSVADARRHEVRQDSSEMRQDCRAPRADPGGLRHHRRHTAYVAPYRGWVYRPLSRGHLLRPAFWRPNYLIDYRFYRLAAPRAGERWIRYGDDVVLVNTRTGRVLEVIRDRL